LNVVNQRSTKELLTHRGGDFGGKASLGGKVATG